MKDSLQLLETEAFASLADCRDRVSNWLSEECIALEDKKEIVSLIEKKDITELRDRFYRELEFGTGGLRGVLGAGNNRMNKYVVRRATQGLCNYIHESAAGRTAPAIAIAHDSRNFSDIFAREAAGVIAANGFVAHLFPTLQTTPCLSFAVRHLGCISGLCVTASHNPPQYNGFKVYWDDGAQVIPPHDKKILDHVLQLTSFSETKYMSFEEGLKTGCIKFIGDEVLDAYFNAVKRLQIYDKPPAQIKIAYTPLHGTGAVPARRAMKSWGFEDFHIVPEQEKPNGAFPTVKKPNPEEPEALKMVVALAEKLGTDIAMATDPDSDRLALVVRDPKAAKGLFKNQSLGDYVLLNGNQTGALMLDYVISGKKETGRLQPNHKVVKTIVTSELLAKISHSQGIEIFDTLTGFKWIAGLIRSWESCSRDFEYLFGTEESFGYMPGSYVRDKDGIAAMCQAAEMVAVQKARGKSPCDRLIEIFAEHGAWQEDLINFDLIGEAGAARIARIMESVRENPPASFAGSRVSAVLDYKTSEKYFLNDAGQRREPKEKLNLPKSDVLQFELQDGGKVSMRPSGTEPKLKIYTSLCTRDRDVTLAYEKTLSRLKDLRKDLMGLIEKIP